jgi:hypothetical protein
VAFVAFVCAASLVSCKNKKDEPQAGTAAGSTIETDITVSLPGQVGGTARRMPGQTVQTNGATDFANNGMNGITLVPFAPSAAVTTSSTRLGSNIVLGSIGTTEAFTDNAAGRAKVFTGQKVPTGTSAFLFYGESGKTGTDFEKGALTASLDGQPSAFTFTLKRINSNAAAVESNAAYTGLIAYLNAVANASDGTKAWKDYTSADNEGLYELFNMYKRATALSSFGVRRMMNDLYNTLCTNTDAMSVAICTAIADATYATVAATGAATGDAYVVTLVSTLQNFPESVNLPQGAVAVAYGENSTTHVWEFDGNAASSFGSLNPAEVDRYVYPASLWYTANTKIKTSTTSKLANYTGASSWKSILATYENDNSSVNTSTRSIALKDTIQYAVARLDVMVKTKENTYLEDNDPVTANNRVDNPAAGYPLTAVLVGGQKNVGFDFTQASYAGGITESFTIYDNVMTNSINAITAAYSLPNSTLVLETPENENEIIALEFTNNSDKDFYGVGGIIIPVGGKFYLVGTLDATAATETGSKVFKQDYTTTARVAIKDLKSAYNTIPNLKAPELEIGLSIDLTWQAGHTYDLEL